MMNHDYAQAYTPPQHQQYLEPLEAGTSHHGAMGNNSNSWDVPSAGGTMLRDSFSVAPPPPASRSAPTSPPRRHYRRSLYRAMANALSDRDESERERDRHRDPEERRRSPIFLSTCQDMVLRLALVAYFWLIVVSIFSMLSPEWVLPYGSIADEVEDELADLAVGPYHLGCSLPTDCNVTNALKVDCRELMKNDFGMSGILIILGIIATFFAMWAIVRVGAYSILFWHFRKDKPNAWRRKKMYRRSPACLSLLAGVLYLVGILLLMGAAQKKYACQEVLCDADRCVYGAAYWFMWFVVAVCFIGTLSLFFMWRFPPKDLASVWAPIELEEERLRKEAENQEWNEYSDSLGQAAVDVDKLITIEVLTRENEHLQSQIQYLTAYAPASRPPMSVKATSFHFDAIPGRTTEQSELELQVEPTESSSSHHLIPNGEEEIGVPLPDSGTVVASGTLHNRPVSPGREAVLMKENQVLTKRLKAIEDKWRQEAIQRKKLFNELQDMKGKIRVMCRSRPFRKEVEDGNIELIFVDEFTIQVPTKNKEFMFDHVFAPDSTQDQVWAECKALAQSALDGYNVCIFAYGQTGSGKTHTMQGPEDNPGITPRMAQEVFETVARVKETHAVSVSCYMVELYLEDLNDLLLAPANRKDAPKLEIKQDVNGVVSIKNVTITPATNAMDLMQIYQRGCKQRHIRSHAMNDQSSRSHLVFSILIESTNNVSGKMITGKLSLVDLAGSERLKKTRINATGVEEATAINDSLFELGKVISDLSSENPAAFVNKRNSKLTLIMADSLGGNAKTMMIVCVSPATFNLPETLNSLEFATRCKKITNAAAKNEDSKQIAKVKQQFQAQLKEQEAEIARLKALLNQ